MSTGYEVFAAITVVDGKPVVDLANTAKYMTITTKDGVVCIVNREKQEFTEIK